MTKIERAYKDSVCAPVLPQRVARAIDAAVDGKAAAVAAAAVAAADSKVRDRASVEDSGPVLEGYHHSSLGGSPNHHGKH